MQATYTLVADNKKLAMHCFTKEKKKNIRFSFSYLGMSFLQNCSLI